MINELFSLIESLLREILQANRPDFHYKLTLILFEEETKRQWSSSFRVSPDATIQEEDLVEKFAVPLRMSRTVDKINKVKSYIKENLLTPIKIAEVARTAGVSANNFSHFFKRHTQMNFSDYVNSVRIEEAMQLLCSSDYTIAEIAYLCGFSSPAYFNDVFKQYKEMTPGEFRKSYEL